jgi:hypothetical protein
VVLALLTAHHIFHISRIKVKGSGGHAGEGLQDRPMFLLKEHVAFPPVCFMSGGLLSELCPSASGLLLEKELKHQENHF